MKRVPHPRLPPNQLTENIHDRRLIQPRPKACLEGFVKKSVVTRLAMTLERSPT
jgi:hypothetical protein